MFISSPPGSPLQAHFHGCIANWMRGFPGKLGTTSMAKCHQMPELPKTYLKSSLTVSMVQSLSTQSIKVKVPWISIGCLKSSLMCAVILAPRNSLHTELLERLIMLWKSGVTASLVEVLDKDPQGDAEMAEKWLDACATPAAPNQVAIWSCGWDGDVAQLLTRVSKEVYPQKLDVSSDVQMLPGHFAQAICECDHDLAEKVSCRKLNTQMSPVIWGCHLGILPQPFVNLIIMTLLRKFLCRNWMARMSPIMCGCHLGILIQPFMNLIIMNMLRKFPLRNWMVRLSPVMCGCHVGILPQSFVHLIIMTSLRKFLFRNWIAQMNTAMCGCHLRKHRSPPCPPVDLTARLHQVICRCWLG